MKNNQNSNKNFEKTGLLNRYKNWIVIFLLTMMILLISIIILLNNKQDNSLVKKEPLNLQDLQPCYLYDEDIFRFNLGKFKNFGDIIISDSPVNGLKQITVKSTGEVFYSNYKGDILFVGVVLDSKGNNLTKAAMDKASQNIFQDIVKTIDKSLAIKIGSGNNELIAFTDPDCGYCRAAEAMLKNNADKLDVTKYIFFTPLDTIHPEAAAKTVHILCSLNPAEELEKVMRNEITEYPNQCEEGKAKLAKHREIGAKLGVNGTPTFYVNGVRYVGANPEIIEKISKK